MIENANGIIKNIPITFVNKPSSPDLIAFSNNEYVLSSQPDVNTSDLNANVAKNNKPRIGK